MGVTELNNGKQRRKDGALELGAMMYGKVPPQAKDLECAVLGSLTLFPEALEISTEYLSAESFYVEANQMVYRAMVSLTKKGQPIDTMTLVEELKFREELDLVGGPYYIVKLQDGIKNVSNFKAHCQIVAQKFLQRELIRVAGVIIGDAYEDSTDVFDLLNEAEKMIIEISQKHLTGGMMTFAQVLRNAVIKVEELQNNDSSISGVPSGFKELDHATRGWQPGDLIVLAARPSVGKTALALNIIRNAAINDLKPVAVGVWSLEMKAVYLALRMMAAQSKVNLHRIQTGRLDDEQLLRVTKDAVNELVKANIFFDESSNINLRMLTAKARRLKKKNELGLIVIDYLQLMSSESNKGGNREQEISQISRGLKNLAMELEIPIIALSQITREHIKNISWGIGPPISSLRESGAIEQDADVVIMMWGANEDEILKDPALEGRRKVKVAKHRNGIIVTVELDFKNEIQLFEAIDNTMPPGMKTVAQADIEFSGPRKGANINNGGDDEDMPF